jgi:hypothetical protein
VVAIRESLGASFVATIKTSDVQTPLTDKYDRDLKPLNTAGIYAELDDYDLTHFFAWQPTAIGAGRRETA